MRHLFIYLGLFFCNQLSYIFLRIYFCFYGKKLLKEKRCVILSDYLNTTLMIDSKELDNVDVWLITTKRYNFYNIILNQRFKKLSGIKFVQDYGDDKREELLAFCKEKNITHVLLQSGDFMVPMLNYLNRELLNGKGNSEIASQCSLNKNVMRDILNKNKISEVSKVAIHNEDDLNNINMIFPLVLKPSVGTASEGVQLVNRKEELLPAYRKSTINMRQTEFDTILFAESYIEGRQFDVEGIIHSGNTHILCIVEENYEGFFPNFDMNWYLFNAIISKTIEKKILEVVTKALNACELFHGAFHCELRINESGEIKILELSNRMGGSFEKPISELTGTNFCDVYIRSMFDKKINIYNKGEMKLDKYFQNVSEFEVWKEYLSSVSVPFVSERIMQPNNKFKISIKSMDANLFYKISEHFSMSIERSE